MASSWFSIYSTIKMMHGPINISIINACGFLRNRSQFCVFIVIFVLSASKLIRNGCYYRRNITSAKICCPVKYTRFISVLLLSLQQRFLFPCLLARTAGTGNVFSFQHISCTHVPVLDYLVG